MHDRWTERRKITIKTITASLIVCLLAGIASSQTAHRTGDTRADSPEAEFHMVRMKYRTFGGAGSHGIIQPWWAIDYPYAEDHFFYSAAPAYQADGVG